MHPRTPSPWRCGISRQSGPRGFPVLQTTDAGRTRFCATHVATHPGETENTVNSGFSVWNCRLAKFTATCTVSGYFTSKLRESTCLAELVCASGRGHEARQAPDETRDGDKLAGGCEVGQACLEQQDRTDHLSRISRVRYTTWEVAQDSH